jgi:hypothetical protein
MFDNTKPNVIFLTDNTIDTTLTKTIGPYKLANELRMAGFEVMVIHHLHVFSVDEIKHLLASAISPQTLFVGVSNFFYRSINQRESWIEQRPKIDYDLDSKEPGAILPHGAEFNNEIKQHINQCNPYCKLVLGGPNAFDRSHIKDYDFVVLGYADVSVVNLANHLKDGVSLMKNYRSIHGATIIDDSLAASHKFVESVMRYQKHDCILPGETLPIEISRGCVFRCSFCSYPLNGKKKLDHIKQEELLFQEFLINYQQHGITRYLFSDDTFNDSVEKVEMIHRISKRLPFELEYWAYIRLDLLTAHPHTADLCIESGLRAVWFGIETLSQETGAIVGKGGNRERMIETLKKLKTTYGNKIMLHGSFIFGLPKESVRSMMSTIAFLSSKDCPLDSSSTYPLMFQRYSYRTSFFNDITKDPAKFGYTEMPGVDTEYFPWQNEHINVFQATKLSAVCNNQVNKKIPVLGSLSFEIAGLGLGLDFSRNKILNSSEVDLIINQKTLRATQYKNLVNKMLRSSICET